MYEVQMIPIGQIAESPFNPRKTFLDVPLGTTAEDLVRHAAFVVLGDELMDWSAPHDFPKRAKAFGVDVKKILDDVAPEAAPSPVPKKAATKRTARKK